MVLADEMAPAAAHGGDVRPPRHAQHLPGIAPAARQMPGLDTGEDPGRNAEDRGDGGKEGLLLRGIDPVGQRDLEEAVEHVLQEDRVGLEDPGDAAGIGVEAGDILPREVEDPGRRRLVAGRQAEDLAEDAHLLGPDLAIGLCHLGPERNDRDREGH